MGPSTMFYTRGSRLLEEEDTQHEFKGHRTVCMDEMSPHFTKLTAKGLHRVSTRQPWSKTLCGYLNCCLGGTLYGGVLDDGTVSGLLLSPYQQLHIQLALEDTMARFQPPLTKDMYELTFVPVVEPGENVESQNTAARMVDQRLWNLRHKLRSYKNCWCDNDSMASVSMGVIPEFFVVEVKVKGAKAGMIYLAEDGICYMRKSARNEKYSVVEVRDLQEERKQQLGVQEVADRDMTGESSRSMPVPSQDISEKGQTEDIHSVKYEDEYIKEKLINIDLDVEWMEEDEDFQERRKEYYQKIKTNLQKEIDLIDGKIVL